MSKKVVFISLPMSGYEDEVIDRNITNAELEYFARFGYSHDEVSFVHNFDTTLPDDLKEDMREGREGVYYLALALAILPHCDEVFFYGNWQEARGCLIEHEVCEKYGIPYVEV